MRRRRREKATPESEHATNSGHTIQHEHRKRTCDDEIGRLASQGSRISNERVKRYISDTDDTQEPVDHGWMKRRRNSKERRYGGSEALPTENLKPTNGVSSDSDYEESDVEEKPRRVKGPQSVKESRKIEESRKREDLPEAVVEITQVPAKERPGVGGSAGASRSLKGSAETSSENESENESESESENESESDSASSSATEKASVATKKAPAAARKSKEDAPPLGWQLRKRPKINYTMDSSFVEVNHKSRGSSSGSSSETDAVSDRDADGDSENSNKTPNALAQRKPAVNQRLRKSRRTAPDSDDDFIGTPSPRIPAQRRKRAEPKFKLTRELPGKKPLTDIQSELVDKMLNYNKQITVDQSTQKHKEQEYNLRNRDKSKSYHIPALPPMSPPRPVAGDKKAVAEGTPARGGDEAVRAEGQAAGSDELELTLPMNVAELGAERCRRAGYVNDALFAAQPATNSERVSFADVGGLDTCIESLKEMTMLPLMYPEIYRGFGIKPPRGVLFHGPPGTGKTLVARALAQSCAGQGAMEPIAFFMRRGADCLSKWVGEAERQLRHLFEQARAFQPSIIFFDELDGLAPVRSARQDQVHASIVATLLALMDGIDDRGQVVVIGATNRPDAIDAALRRPGRFDREMLFRLPNAVARQRILGIHTRRWTTPLSDALMADIVQRTQGWGGADLSALCTEAALAAVRRAAPLIYSSDKKVDVDVGAMSVLAADVEQAMRRVVPSTRRGGRSGAQALPSALVPLLGAQCEAAGRTLGGLLRHPAPLCRPRMAVVGAAQMCVDQMCAAVAHAVESQEIPVFVLGVQEMLGSADGSAAQHIARVFAEARRCQPSLVVVPAAHRLPDAVAPGDIELLDSCVAALGSQDRVGILVSATCTTQKPCDLWSMAMPAFARRWFVGCLPSTTRVFVAPPTDPQLHAFLAPLFSMLGGNPTAVSPPPDVLPMEVSVDALAKAIVATVAKLKKSPIFQKCINPYPRSQFKAFYQKVRTPMFLSIIECKATTHCYHTAADFLSDIELIGHNALQFFEFYHVDIVSASSWSTSTGEKQIQKTRKLLQAFCKSSVETAKTSLYKFLGRAQTARSSSPLLPTAFANLSTDDACGLSSPITTPSTPLTSIDGFSRPLVETQMVTPSSLDFDEIIDSGTVDLPLDSNALCRRIGVVSRSLPIEALESLRAYLIAAATVNNTAEQRHVHGDSLMTVSKALGLWENEYRMSLV
ncbi:TAT-binding protein-like protein 7, AAA ATPase [Coemansia sp. RSA 1722]|nr:TAT-binding protein-like protein 7, AAA ATPase [Coemansia sp. RSA 486]KAJ2228918.1 TAT-binding protein-like protein 7, AAA ATPase [Coemansia sp. RSA 485]KAJ2591306.1 TAT-binding protein-like protein 7, AAA ATPase [Coemansia sp. RSA 1722]